ncbi:hypothetical protein [Marinimicrobium agarilyticum]|uniref:hypothetical protein n=1 Tax=Marinimicrobium agarilyticum TaxID=306546 RepID=UPI0004864DFD|nr:hypothetical protein [Marinimicrobium agarilyticum]
MFSIAHSTVLLLLSVALTACSPKGQAESHAAQKVKDKQTKEDVLARVAADLNGDGITDQAMLIPYSAMDEDRIQRYQPVSAWPYYSDDAPPSDPADGGPVVLVIEHGEKGTQQKPEDFLLYDPNEVSVLATDAAKILTSTGVNALPKAGATLAELPQPFTGDVLVLPTEAGIDTFVYWTGETYRVFEPLEMP